MVKQIPIDNAKAILRHNGGLLPSRKSLLHDFMASIVVFLVALPLCMGIAVASNAPIAAGLITGVIGGLVVGVLAGAPLQVSGPAAGLSVLVYQLVHEFGLEALGFVVVIAGLVQLIAGALRLGQWFRAVSPAVVQGMLAGIGVLILASQFHVMVDDSPRASGIENLASIPESFWKGVVPGDDTTHHYAARIGVLTIIILAGWKLAAPKRLRIIPAPLVAVVAATLLADVQNLAIKFVELPGNLLQAIKLPTWESWRLIGDKGATLGEILLAGITFGFVASAETLLSVTATDRLHQGPRAKYDRELMAQGIGNVLCGCVSALPMTGVIVRSTANIDAGAKSRWSAVLHGCWILLFVSTLPHALQLIPKACLGAILVYTGYKLVAPRAAKSLLAYGKSEFLIYLTTLVLIVLADLLTGVLIGIGMSSAKLLYTFSHVKIDLRHDPAANECRLRLGGAVTFLRLPKLAETFENLPPGCALHVDISRVDYIDHACLDLLMNWQRQHEDRGGTLNIDWGQLHTKFFNGPKGRLTQVDPISLPDTRQRQAFQHS
ncbi:MAG: SulP family inorganic anion transporter [Pirellulales bacterium]|nr:SulP family inorganic anion transporter [Pirellulales bacterium]